MTNPGGKGSTQRPLAVEFEEWAKNFDTIFKPKDKHKVSGVPYKVGLDDALLKHEPCSGHAFQAEEDMIATLEHENRCLRARIERLEEELRNASRTD